MLYTTLKTYKCQMVHGMYLNWFISEHGVRIKPMFELKLRFCCKFFPSISDKFISEGGLQLDMFETIFDYTKEY